MTTSSLRLIDQCQERGLLSKEAAANVATKRENLIKAAMKRQGKALADSIRALTKEAGPIDFLASKFRSAEKGGEKVVDKLKAGGLTPGGSRVGWHDVGLNMAKMLGLAGLTAGATAGAGAILHHSRDKKLKGKIEQSYGKMFEINPDLKELDQDAVARHFGILARFAPSLAAEPEVAGPWVYSVQKERGIIPPLEIKNLAETQRRIDEMHESRHGGPQLAPLNVKDIVHPVLSGALRGG